MSAVNAGQLLILVWTFTAVCQADDDHISVSCADVSGTVGEGVTLACNVSLKCSERCIKMYKFQYPEGYNESEICKEFPQSSCEQRNSFTCRFTPNTAMTGQFRFFVQTRCGGKTSGFILNITEPIKPEPDTEDHVKKDPKTAQQVKSLPVAGTRKYVITAVMGCFFIILFLTLIITMAVIYNRKPNDKRPWIPGFLSRRRDEENSDGPDDMS